VSPLELPETLVYEPEFLSEEEEAELVAGLEGLEFEEVMRRSGSTASRPRRLCATRSPFVL
jgi:hypothetical protein